MRAARTVAVFCIVGAGALALAPTLWGTPQLERAFLFGSRDLTCPVFNEPGTNYTAVVHAADDAATVQALAYDAGRGWGYEAYLDPYTIDQTNPYGDRGGWEAYGPFDRSPNNRTRYGAWGTATWECPFTLYDSFIGCVNFQQNCDSSITGDIDTPCYEFDSATYFRDGIIFRVDVPNGKYRFVMAVGSSSNAHHHRIIVEDGGTGGPQDLGLDNYVVPVHNYSQAEYCPGTFARVGFGCYLPPPAVSPNQNNLSFANIDASGLVTTNAPNSPTLEVTEGYLRVHCLQANANDGACATVDRNGGDLVVLEIWNVGEEQIDPGVLPVVATRTIEPDVYDPGDPVSVTLDVSGVGGSTTITETIPAGFQVMNDGGGNLAGDELSFTLTDDGSVTYTIQAAGCIPGEITGTIVSAAQVCTGFPDPTISGDSIVACSEGLTLYGGVQEFLMIGPTNLEDDPANGWDDQGRFLISDYMTDGALITEGTVLVKEGDSWEPDYNLSAGGVGVLTVTNTAVNPDAANGTLTVWRGIATDDQGGINFGSAGNYGANEDTDFVQYCLVYLDNTEGSCRDVVLEVGSDDAHKTLVNGNVVYYYDFHRALPAHGSGEMIAVSLAPGKNPVLIAVLNRGGNAAARLVVRNPDGTPVIDGSVVVSLVPPEEYPAVPTFDVARTIDPAAYDPGDLISVTLEVTNATSGVVVTDTIPWNLTVNDTAGGTVNEDNINLVRTIEFTFAGNGTKTYTLKAPDGECDCSPQIFSGTARATQGCASKAVGGDTETACLPEYPDCIGQPATQATLVSAFAFGVHPDLSPTGTNGQAEEWCETPNQPGTAYTAVEHADRYDDMGMLLRTGIEFLRYEGNENRGWGFVSVWDLLGGDPPWGVRGGYGEFGAFDDSANNRNKYNADTAGPVCGEELYDSFIGGKTFTAECSELTVGDTTTPCAEANPPVGPEGIIFRVDVPDGSYRFVGAFGDADNHHAHRIVAEDSGTGTLPGEITGNTVVLVHNFAQAEYGHGEADAAQRGEGVYARVGFDGRMPPLGDGTPPDPQFVNMDENGMATIDCANSPTLTVTGGYILFHCLQANSNDGCGGPRNPDGGDLVILEIWSIDGGNGKPVFKRGDSNRDGGVNIADAVYILQNLFAQGPPIGCDDAADSNDDEGVNIADAVYILQNLFAQGPPLPAPGVDVCGPDPTGHPTGGAELGCADYCASACQVPPVACPPIE